jgi:hypothetical protein
LHFRTEQDIGGVRRSRTVAVLNAGFVFSGVNINVNATIPTTAQIVAIRMISVDLRFIPSSV